MRFIGMVKLPFDLGVCIWVELLARLARFFDSRSCDSRETRRNPSFAELRGVEPCYAFCLVIWPFLPAFRHSLCDVAKSGQESCWEAYDTQSKDAAKLAGETNWPRVAKATWRSSLQLLRPLWKVHLPLLCTKLKGQVMSIRSGQPAPEATGSRLPRDQVLTMLAEASEVQTIAQEKISSLARKVATDSQPNLSFLEAHQKVLVLDLPKDPMEAHGLSEADLPQLFADYEDDEAVMIAAGQLLSPSFSRSDPDAAAKITLDRIIEIHQLMETRMKSVLEEFEQLPAALRDVIPRKVRENTAELLVSTAVESKFGIRCEDIEMAVVMHEEELKEEAEFARCTEELASLVQSLTGVKQPGI